MTLYCGTKHKQIRTSVGIEMCQMVNMASAASTFVQAIGRILRIPTATLACHLSRVLELTQN